MNRFVIPLAAFGLVVVMFAVSLHRVPEKQVIKSALIGKPAPEFSLPSLLETGATVNVGAFKGRWVLVNVWGTWCVECKAEHGTLLDIQREGKAVVLGINYKDNDEAARKWLAEYGNPYAAVAVDREGRAAIDYGVYGAPENFLVNPQGIIVKKAWGLTAKSWDAIRQEFIEGAKP